jgi:hypothetical protein
MNPDTLEHIRDNGGFSLLPGLNLGAVTGLDSLSFSIGLLGSYDRIRGVYDFSIPLGFLAEIVATYKGVGLHGTLYSGKSQVITSGDGFYKSTFYTRADLFYKLKLPYIEGRAQFSFHFIPGTVDVSMSLVIRAQLDGAFRNHQPSSLK